MDPINCYVTKESIKYQLHLEEDFGSMLRAQHMLKWSVCTEGGFIKTGYFNVELPILSYMINKGHYRRKIIFTDIFIPALYHAQNVCKAECHQ
jgi:hypothetical protein